MLKKLCLLGAIALGSAVTASAQMPAGPTPVVMVMMVEVGATPTATVPRLVELMKRAETLSRKAGPNAGSAKLYTSSLGGAPDQFAVVVEFPSITAYAASEVAHANDSEWQKMNNDAMAAGFKVVSRSLMAQVKF
jgi:hypothetical protein